MKYFILSLILLVATTSFVSGQELRPKVAFDYYANKDGYHFKINNQRFDVSEFRTRLGLDFVGSFSKHKPILKDLKYIASIDTHTFAQNAGGLKFDPRLVNFYIGGGVSYKNIKLNYTHMCTHATKSSRSIPLEIYGSYDMISISYGY